MHYKAWAWALKVLAAVSQAWTLARLKAESAWKAREQAAACHCRRQAKTQAWLKALRPIEPKAIDDERATIIRAAHYETIASMEGWRDFIGVVTHYRQQLERSLLEGKFAPVQRPNATTDDEVRAMIFICDRLLGIPSAIASRYDITRDRQKQRERLLSRAESWSTDALA